MDRMRVAAIAVFSLLGVLLMHGGSAFAAPAWMTSGVPAGAGEGLGQTTARTVAAPDGTVTVVTDALKGDNTLVTHVYTRPPGGQFSASGTWDGSFSQIVGGPDGSVAVLSYVLNSQVPENSKSYVRVRRPGGDFDAPTELATGVGNVKAGFVAPDGTFWAILNDAAKDIFLLRRFTDGSVKRDGIITLDPGERLLNPDLLRLPNGTARVLMNVRGEFQDDAHGKCELQTTVIATSITPEGAIAAPTTVDFGKATEDKGAVECNAQPRAYLDAGSVALAPAWLAAGPGGEASLVYTGVQSQGPGQSGRTATVRATVPQDNGWGDLKGETVTDANMPALGAAYAGNDLVVVLLQLTGGALVTQHLDGAWTPPSLLAASITQAPTIVGSPQGTALIVFRNLPAPGQVFAQPGPIRAVVRRPGGQFDAAVTLDQASVFASSWADQDGDLGVTMDHDSDPDPIYNSLTYVKVFDGAAPKLTVKGPASGTAGQTVGNFEATATDIWSGVPDPVSWTFTGGGGDAVGSPVSHVFGASGRQTATAKVVDAVGNEATATTELDVGAAPAPTPEPSTQPPAPTPTPTPTRLCPRRRTRRSRRSRSSSSPSRAAAASRRSSSRCPRTQR